MKKSFFLLFGAGGALLTSCSDVYDVPRDEQYSKDFVEVFGKIDPNQDWNMAEEKSVTVTADPGSTVKVFAHDGTAYRLAGVFNDFSGTRTLKVAALEGNEQLVVSDGKHAKLVADGGSVNLCSTRGYVDGFDGNLFEKTDYQTFSAETVNTFTSRTPEGTPNKDKGLEMNFSAFPKENTEVVIYPVFWQTCNTIEFGVYFGGDINKKHKLFTTGRSVEGGEFYSSDDVQYSTDGGNTWNNHRAPYRIGNADQSNCCVPNKDNVTNYRARGIKLKIGNNTEFGFYIKVTTPQGADQGTFYSEKEFNDPENSMAAVFTTSTADKDLTFVGFEDWNNSGADGDLNDFMVIMDPQPEIITHESQEFILACEDLGSNDDFDFNDVVFSVKHTVGEEVAYITPLAAGGVLPIELFYGDQPIGGELHSQFGVASNVMVNTNAAGGVDGKTAETVKINVAKNFSILTLDRYEQSNSMQGFKLKVNGGEREITSPTKGHAPQMISVPANWKWPKERIGIHEAYPDFSAWGADYNNKNWHLSPVEGKIVD